MEVDGKKKGKGNGLRTRGGKTVDTFMDVIDHLTVRLTDLSNHARIEVGAVTAVDFASLPLKPDHSRRPFWVTPTGSIYLEATSPLYEQARDFLVAICEPVSRPEFIHEYRLDKNALFAAASMGLTSDVICSALNRLSKVPVAQVVLDFVHACTTGYGKVKLVLQRGRYYLESAYPAILRLLNRHPAIRAARVTYGPDGKRRVGLDAVAPSLTAGGGGAGSAAAALASTDALGFEVSSALAEAEGSIGLRGIMNGADAATGGGGAAAWRTGRVGGAGGDTAGGALTRRVAGEVDSDDDDDDEANAAALSRAAATRCAAASAASLSSTSKTAASSSAGAAAASSLKGAWDRERARLLEVGGAAAAAAAAAVFRPLQGAAASSSGASVATWKESAATAQGLLASVADDLARLTEEDIAALIEAVTDAERAAAQEEKLLKGGAAGAAAEATAAVSSTDAVAVATGATKLSFSTDQQRLVATTAAVFGRDSASSSASAVGSAAASATVAGSGAAASGSGRAFDAAIAARKGKKGGKGGGGGRKGSEAAAAAAELSSLGVDAETVAAARAGLIDAEGDPDAPRYETRGAAAAAAGDTAADDAYDDVSAAEADVEFAVAGSSGDTAEAPHAPEVRTASDLAAARREEAEEAEREAAEAAAQAAGQHALAELVRDLAAAGSAGGEEATNAAIPAAAAATDDVRIPSAAAAAAVAVAAAGRVTAPAAVATLPAAASGGGGSAKIKLRLKIGLPRQQQQPAGDEAAQPGPGQGAEAAGAKRHRPAPAEGAGAGAAKRGRRDGDGDGDDDEYSGQDEDEEAYSSGEGSNSSGDGRKKKKRGGRRPAGGRRGGASAAADGGLGGRVTAAQRRRDAAAAGLTSGDADAAAAAAATAASTREFDALYRRLHAATSLQELHTPGRVERFEVDPAQVDAVKRLCLFLDPPLPLIQEYDFRHDAALPALPIRLRDPSALRPYQERSLAKMFGNGRARSGIIVLPCGAGKTLVGLTAAATIGKSVIILCPNQTSVGQWVEQLHRYTDVSRRHVCTLTAKKKEPLPPLHEPVVLLTTYTMIGSGGRGAESAAVLRAIAAREWGCMLLDEVHQAVATTFSKALRLRAHCRLGLTATLVREDGRDKRLALFIGPKLYEANWMDLTRAGYLANVQVAEVWCPMTPEFYREYLGAPSQARRKALAVMNPTKCAAMDYLVGYHEARGDKIIIFSESVFALRLYSEQYQTLPIDGATKPDDREAIIRAFKTPNSGVNKLFLSRVGDVALDVPDANVIVQISSHFGSRLQEAQRMGRILRRGTAAGGGGVSGQNAFFYTLVSTDTSEMYFSNKRRRYLVDQGYAYKVLMAGNLVPAPIGETAAAAAGGGGAAAGPASGGAAGLARLFARASFMATRERQLRMLETITLQDVDAAEGGEEQHMREFEAEGPEEGAAEAAPSSKRAAGYGAAAAVGALVAATGRFGSAGNSLLPPTRALPAATAADKAAARGGSAAGASRTALSGLSSLTGGAGVAYLEYEADVHGLDALRAAEEAAATERRAMQRAAAAGAGGAVKAKPPPQP